MTDESEAIKADIEQARAELAETADALAAKLDVKSQAGKKMHEAGDRAVGVYESAKSAAPPPVQRVWDRTERAAAPVAAKVNENRRQAALVLLGAVAAALIARRFLR